MALYVPEYHAIMAPALKRVARMFYTKITPAIADDLIQEGYVGILIAKSRYTESKGQWEPFAYFYAFGYMVRFMKREFPKLKATRPIDPEDNSYFDEHALDVKRQFSHAYRALNQCSQQERSIIQSVMLCNIGVEPTAITYGSTRRKVAKVIKQFKVAAQTK